VNICVLNFFPSNRLPECFFSENSYQKFGVTFSITISYGKFLTKRGYRTAYYWKNHQLATRPLLICRLCQRLLKKTVRIPSSDSQMFGLSTKLCVDDFFKDLFRLGILILTGSGLKNRLKLASKHSSTCQRKSWAVNRNRASLLIRAANF
jgi:hypothetical protein